MAINKTPRAAAAKPIGFGGLLAPVLAVLLPALPARAGSVSASLAVSVVVPPRAILSVETQPATLRITGEDVARGWVDVPAAARVQARTNAPAGWLLQLEVAPGPWSAIEVAGLGSPSVVGVGGGFLAQPYPGSTKPVFLELSYRFQLAADAAPGLYPWPVALAAAPR